LTGTEITRFGLIVGTDTETIPGQNGATDTQVVTYQVAWFTEVSPSVPGDALTEVEPPESTG
jgi:hypothetical protein